MQESATIDLRPLVEKMDLAHDEIVFKTMITNAHNDDDFRTVAERLDEIVKNTKAKMKEIDQDPIFDQPPLQMDLLCKGDSSQRHHWLRRIFCSKPNTIKLVNNTSRHNLFLCTQEILRVIVDHIEGRTKVDPKGAELALVLGRKAVYVKQFESLMPLPPSETRYVLVEAPVVLTVFQADGSGAMIGTEWNIYIKAGYQYTTKENDLSCAKVVYPGLEGLKIYWPQEFSLIPK
ncbi:hypothetical protein BGZ97_008108 [Linnemannia gamsii]|uniref:Uncharacterized protein n=1 Tax=Linnemannia gamsii TaxID=64522 RepID=A0A9P6QPS4_9FUNG|nr:hypothetical protein BGZ97_008108 [Linnemannia gamsii]